MWLKIKNLLFANRSVRQTVAKNTFWLGVSNIGGRLLRAIVIIYAARVLGASEWGVFSYAVSLTAFLTIFTDIGVSPVMTREMAKLRGEPENQRRILSTAFFIKTVLLLLGLGVIFFATPYFMPNEKVRAILPLIAFIFAFDSIRDFGFSLVRSMEKMEWEAALYLLTNLAIVVFGFIFLASSSTVISFTAAYTAGAGIGMLATVYALRHHLRGVFSGFSRKLVPYILGSGWPFTLSAILGILMIDMDVLIIGWLRSAEEVGLYSAAQRIVQLLYILPSILATSLLPTFSRLAGRDEKKFKFGFEGALWAAYSLAIPISIGGVLLGGEMIELVFGPGFAGAALPFRILMLTLLISFPAVILTGVIFTHNKQRQLAVYAAIGGISNIVLDLLVIPRYGIGGAAVVTLFAQILSNLYLWRVVRSIVKPDIVSRLKRVFVAAAVMGAAVFVFDRFDMNVILAVILGGAIYLGALLLLKEPVVQEIKLIFAAKDGSGEA